MNSLRNERPAAFNRPGAFPGTRIIFRRAIPLHVGIGLENPTQTVFGEGLAQKKDRVVKAMLAYHSELNSRGIRSLDHAARDRRGGSHRLLHQDVLFRLGAKPDSLRTIIGQRANVDEVNAGMTAELLTCSDEFGPVGLCELHASSRRAVGAGYDVVANPSVSLSVFTSDGACSDDADPHPFLPLFVLL